ncbi:hypothetical protein B4099_1152 [Heyndrickxia coagulans]|uniref:Uncharacterized protein n=1 Tax=Heyndrickxia coagulans TaxID=1398 RepID=A0A150KIN4_HEYCO|nr:hypothetical protein B4099_1152 [Heyndrickxia coagulans]
MQNECEASSIRVLKHTLPDAGRVLKLQMNAGFSRTFSPFEPGMFFSRLRKQASPIYTSAVLQPGERPPVLHPTDRGHSLRQQVSLKL